MSGHSHWATIKHKKGAIDARRGKLFSKLKAVGMPTTLLLDRQGREIGRLVGPAAWDSLEALALIKAAIAAPANA